MTVADRIGKDEIVARGIEQLLLAEKLAGKLLAQKVAPFTRGSMHDQDGIANDALVIALRTAERTIVHPQLGQSFAGREMKIAKDEVAGLRRRVFRCAR